MTKTYTEEFKQDAVRLVETSGKPKTQVARELGISDSALYRWLKVYGVDAPQPSVSHGQTVKALEAELRMALGQRVLTGPLIHHTDRGSQSTADAYLALLTACGVSVRMSGKGDPYDHAMGECFFSTLRAACTELHRFAPRREARLAVLEYSMVFYHRQRLHSALGFCSPTDFEAAHSH